MKLSRAAIIVYIGLVFASGAVLGALGHRLYTVSTVSAKGTRNPEEFRKRVISTYQTRLKLTDTQVSQLSAIMDETRSRVEETRQKMKPAYQKIHEEQTDKIRAMLNPEQQVEYEKIRKEREAAREKQTSRAPGRF
jgi:Spy/CpxP family protein refolding chaperone